MSHGFGSIVLGCDVGLSLEIWHERLMSAHIHPTEDPKLPGRVSGCLVIQWRDRITPIPARCPWGTRDQPARFSGSRRANASSARPLPVRALVDCECLTRLPPWPTGRQNSFSTTRPDGAPKCCRLGVCGRTAAVYPQFKSAGTGAADDPPSFRTHSACRNRRPAALRRQPIPRHRPRSQYG